MKSSVTTGRSSVADPDPGCCWIRNRIQTKVFYDKENLFSFRNLLLLILLHGNTVLLNLPSHIGKVLWIPALQSGALRQVQCCGSGFTESVSGSRLLLNPDPDPDRGFFYDKENFDWFRNLVKKNIKAPREASDPTENCSFFNMKFIFWGTILACLDREPLGPNWIRIRSRSVKLGRSDRDLDSLSGTDFFHMNISVRCHGVTNATYSKWIGGHYRYSVGIWNNCYGTDIFDIKISVWYDGCNINLNPDSKWIGVSRRNSVNIFSWRSEIFWVPKGQSSKFTRVYSRVSDPDPDWPRDR